MIYENKDDTHIIHNPKVEYLTMSISKYDLRNEDSKNDLRNEKIDIDVKFPFHKDTPVPEIYILKYLLKLMFTNVKFEMIIFSEKIKFDEVLETFTALIKNIKCHNIDFLREEHKQIILNDKVVYTCSE